MKRASPCPSEGGEEGYETYKPHGTHKPYKPHRPYGPSKLLKINNKQNKSSVLPHLGEGRREVPDYDKSLERNCNHSHL